MAIQCEDLFYSRTTFQKIVLTPLEEKCAHLGPTGLEFIQKVCLLAILLSYNSVVFLFSENLTIVSSLKLIILFKRQFWYFVERKLVIYQLSLLFLVFFSSKKKVCLTHDSNHCYAKTLIFARLFVCSNSEKVLHHFFNCMYQMTKCLILKFW